MSEGRKIPVPPYESDNPTDAIATALNILAIIAEEQRRQSVVLERIAERLDADARQRPVTIQRTV